MVKAKKVAPWIPSTREVIITALKLARAGSNDVVYDLGAGDGRVLVIAAKEFHSKCVGIEIDKRLCGVIEVAARYHGVEDKVKVICDDFFSVSLSDATIVYMYLYRSINEELASKLDKELRPGARIVTIDFPIPGWTPLLVKRLIDRTGLIRTIFLYMKGVSNISDIIKRVDEVFLENVLSLLNLQSRT